MSGLSSNFLISLRSSAISVDSMIDLMVLSLEP